MPPNLTNEQETELEPEQEQTNTENYKKNQPSKTLFSDQSKVLLLCCSAILTFVNGYSMLTSTKKLHMQYKNNECKLYSDCLRRERNFLASTRRVTALYVRVCCVVCVCDCVMVIRKPTRK